MATPNEYYPGSMLQQFRRVMGLSQEYLAELMKKAHRYPFSQSDVSRTERGEFGVVELMLRSYLTVFYTDAGFIGDGTGAFIYLPRKW